MKPVSHIICSALCQLHLNKTGIKKKEIYVILKMFLNISCGNIPKIIVLAKLTLFSPDCSVFLFSWCLLESKSFKF